MVKTAIHNFWTTKIISDASSKSTLKYLAIQNYRVGVTHNIWTDASVDTQAVKKAGVKARLTTGTYMLQTSRAKFSKQGVSPVCQLCHTGDEDIAHFLLSCSSLVIGVTLCPNSQAFSANIIWILVTMTMMTC